MIITKSNNHKTDFYQNKTIVNQTFYVLLKKQPFDYNLYLVAFHYLSLELFCYIMETLLGFNSITCKPFKICVCVCVFVCVFVRVCKWVCVYVARWVGRGRSCKLSGEKRKHFHGSHSVSLQIFKILLKLNNKKTKW